MSTKVWAVPCARFEPRLDDVRVGFARQRAVLDGYEAHEYLRSTYGRYSALADMFNAALSATGQEHAFGAVGEEGDPARIVHLAQRLLSVYDEFLSISEDIRGTVVPQELEEARNAAALAALKPLEDMHAFIQRFREQVNEIPELLIQGETITLEMVAEISVDTVVLERLAAALNAGFSQLED